MPKIDYKHNIAQAKVTIYDPITIGDPALWVPSGELESILNDALTGLDLQSLPLRTRSKVVKSAICRALGYPVPNSFKKTRPRFPGQQFDTYVQKRNNLQVWNEQVSPSRRYVIIRPNASLVIQKVKVLNGEELAKFDKTGTLTKKLQARLVTSTDSHELISKTDTSSLEPLVTTQIQLATMNPTDPPELGSLYPISEVFARLHGLVGKIFPDPGSDQERLRGAALHAMVCSALGYAQYGDTGSFPDVTHQLLEVKLQTSPTVDLGLISPASEEPLDIPQVYGSPIRHCDVRYALFYAKTDGKTVTITHLFVTTGKDFFGRFEQFKGKVVNAKLQIPLPDSLFA